MFRTSLIAATFLFCSHTAMVQQAPAPTQPPPPAEHAAPPSQTPRYNPVKPTPASQARAKTIYGYDCASCHGEKGDGKGDLAKDLGLTPPDFTNPATLKDKLDGELFDTIKNGKGQMPAEGDRAKTDEVWNLVLYCRSFAQKGAPAPDKGKTAQ